MVFPRVIFLIFGFSFLVVSEGLRISRKERATSLWGYTSENGPITWGGVCRSGTKQSPINIKLGNTIVKNFPSFKFGDDYLKKQRFIAKNNGHTVLVTLEDNRSKPIIYGGGLEGSFLFEQLHFHWESEHEFEGKRADLEMHMVHYNLKYGSFAEAATKPDGLAVLAVLFDEEEETDYLIEDFFAQILNTFILEQDTPIVPPANSLQDNIDKDRECCDLFSLKDLLPKHVSRFFRYDGSLTTPGCDEVVQWTVFINRFPVSKNVLESFRIIRDHDHNLIEQNYRPPQKLNGREVYIQIDNHEEGQNEIGLLSNSCINNSNYFYLLLFCLILHFRYSNKF